MMNFGENNMPDKANKTKYRALCNGTELFAWAYSEKQAKILLMGRAKKQFGKFNFTDFFKWVDVPIEDTHDKSGWKRISYGF